MYSLVMYNISPIQQGIQAYHATIEAVNSFGNSNTINEEQFKNWAQNWKTVIILNGGTSKDIELHHDILWKNKVRHNYFREPDLNNAMSAISFIVDERVFNKEKYPNFIPTNGLITNDIFQPGYNEWLEFMGGEKNVFLREFLQKFKLA